MLHLFFIVVKKKSEKMEEKTSSSVTSFWMKKHKLEYTGATRHPFTLAIRDGSVHSQSFKRWLGQGYTYMSAFIPFVASLLLKAWKESDDATDMDVILGGMAIHNDEIAWFKKEATKFQVALNSVVPLETNLEYCRFLESLMSPDVDYTQALTAYWAIETVYQESFAHCLEDDNKTPEELKETCQRWGNAHFGQYCKALKTIVDRRLENASADVIAKAEANFLSILEHEVEFWNVSDGGL